MYLAEDTLLERPVAIKFIASQWPDPRQRSRFFTEARAIARLQHPNVVAIHRIGEVQQRPYLVQEFVRGTSLKDSPVPLPPERVLQIALGLARGLAAVHREHVLHRDVKPSNILLLPDGGVKLLDFGLALLQHTAAGPGEEPLTPAGMVAGTPGYLAPEVLRGEPPSPRSDLYALGVVLHQVLRGHRPFEESTATRSGPEASGGDTPLPEAGLAAPAGDGLEARLWRLVHRCLEYDPASRFASAEELADALHALTETPSTQGVPSGNPYRGLQAFEAEHRAFFFGRETEVHGVLERLRFYPLVLVAGDSGVGKSSLCRAGVLPRVLEGALGNGRAYTGVSLMPGLQPFTALVAALARWLGMGEQELAAQVLHEPQALGRLLRAGLGPRRGLLLFIDQLEELFTQSEPREAAAFAEALGRLALPVDGVRTLMTVRGDFFTRLAAFPSLGEEVVRALFLLKPLTAQGTREAIVGPAHRTGVAFETEALVSGLVESSARAPGGLPILQFALAELWEARDRERQLITEASLQALGGVGGALGHHADGVLAMLPAPARQAARRMLLRLMTGEGTRVRRRAEELDAARPAHHTALEALVRARLVVARQAGGENVYEVAHEALLQGWSTLRDWIAAEGAQRAVLQRVEEAASAWERMGRPDSALWTRRQLSEVTGELDLKPQELTFLAASRGAVRRAWRRRAALAVMVPLAVLLTWGGTWAKHRYELEREISQRTAMAHDALREARARKDEAEAARSEAFRVLDALGERVLAGEKPAEAERFARAEALWTAAREGDRRAEEAYLLATRSLDAALLRDSTRTQVRELLAEVILDRITLAEWFYRPQQRGELVLRLASLDEGGASRRSLTTPPRLSLITEPPDAEVLLQPMHHEEEAGTPPATVVLGRTPLTRQMIEPGPGSYLLTLRAPGHAPAVLPVLLAPDEQLEARIPLPEASAIPEGFVYVPPGRFLFGSSEDEALRREFLQAPPLRPVTTASYLISRYEVTFAEWITFLSALPPEERARRMPGIQSPVGALRLTEERGGWRLMLQPTTQPFTARSGEPIRYPGRTHRATQDWLRMPVSAISREDALAYLAWLDRSGRLPGARLCTEYEWERANRGADSRLFPSGDVLNPDDANFDETYGRHPLGFGPDEVGAHPASASPFGVMDLAGNVMEWVRSVRDPDEAVVRVGAWYYDRLSNRSNNRLVVEPMLRDLRIGLRVCASLR